MEKNLLCKFNITHPQLRRSTEIGQRCEAIADFKVNKSPAIDGTASKYANKIKDILAKPLRLKWRQVINKNLYTIAFESCYFLFFRR